jgi:hypothetical protein
VTVRDANDQEREQLRMTLGDSYRDLFHHATDVPLADAEALAEAGIRQPLAASSEHPLMLRVAAVNGQPVVGALSATIGTRAKLVTVFHVWIDPAAEHPDAVVRLLLADLEALAVAAGAARIQFVVLLSDDRARRACEAAGYTSRSVSMSKRL